VQGSTGFLQKGGGCAKDPDGWKETARTDEKRRSGRMERCGPDGWKETARTDEQRRSGRMERGGPDGWKDQKKFFLTALFSSSRLKSDQNMPYLVRLPINAPKSGQKRKILKKNLNCMIKGSSLDNRTGN
jgi:hypothetical protein